MKITKLEILIYICGAAAVALEIYASIGHSVNPFVLGSATLFGIMTILMYIANKKRRSSPPY